MLRAPRIRAFTKEKNTSAINNVVNVHYGPSESQKDSETFPVVDPIPEKTREVVIEQNTQTEKVLKLMLEAYKDNPLHVNDYIVLTQEKLVDLVMELTQADKVELSISADIACCGPISKITYLDGIVVHKDDATKDFKIGYNEEYRFLENYRITSDFVVKAD